MAAQAGSLVAAVLAHSGRLDKEHLGARVGRLSRRVEELKARDGSGGGTGNEGARGETWGRRCGGADQDRVSSPGSPRGPALVWRRCPALGQLDQGAQP